MEGAVVRLAVRAGTVLPSPRFSRASFRPVPRGGNSSCGLRFFGLLFMHMPLCLG